MSTILDTIAEATKERVRKAKLLVPAESLREQAFALAAGENFEEGDILPFEKALRKDGISLICECKKASPSKGIIAEDFPYLQIAKEYEKAGASAISVLTEPQWFLGDLSYLSEIAKEVSIPCLRKDFTVDEYMIYEAKIAGASAVLLICSILDLATLKKFHALCDELHLSALVEAHDESEVEMALAAGARIIGVNNRNLTTFTTSIENTMALLPKIGEGRTIISESGVQSPEDAERLREAGCDGILVGEGLVTAPSVAQMTRQLSSVGGAAKKSA